MYGACRVVGIGPPVFINGRAYPIHARTIEDYAHFEARILQLRGNPFDNLRWLCCYAGGDEAAKKIFDKLRGDHWWDVTFGELLEWLGTWEGRIYSLWRATGADLPDVQNWVASESGSDPELWWAGIQDGIDLANGEDELAALDWLRDGSEASSPINWTRIIRNIGEEPFNIPPREAVKMTLAQVRAFHCEKDAAGQPNLPPVHSHAAMLKFEKRMKDDVERAVGNLKAGRHWNAR